MQKDELEKRLLQLDDDAFARFGPTKKISLDNYEKEFKKVRKSFISSSNRHSVYDETKEYIRKKFLK